MHNNSFLYITDLKNSFSIISLIFITLKRNSITWVGFVLCILYFYRVMCFYISVTIFFQLWRMSSVKYFSPYSKSKFISLTEMSNILFTYRRIYDYCEEVPDVAWLCKKFFIYSPCFVIKGFRLVIVYPNLTIDPEMSLLFSIDYLVFVRFWISFFISCELYEVALGWIIVDCSEKSFKLSFFIKNENYKLFKLTFQIISGENERRRRFRPT